MGSVALLATAEWGALSVEHNITREMVKLHGITKRQNLFTSRFKRWKIYDAWFYVLFELIHVSIVTLVVDGKGRGFAWCVTMYVNNQDFMTSRLLFIFDYADWLWRQWTWGKIRECSQMMLVMFWKTRNKQTWQNIRTQPISRSFKSMVVQQLNSSTCKLLS